MGMEGQYQVPFDLDGAVDAADLAELIDPVVIGGPVAECPHRDLPVVGVGVVVGRVGGEISCGMTPPADVLQYGDAVDTGAEARPVEDEAESERGDGLAREPWGVRGQRIVPLNCDIGARSDSTGVVRSPRRDPRGVVPGSPGSVAGSW
jgi:hypothetical protein